MEEMIKKNRYSDEELMEFKELILKKLDVARDMLRNYQDQLMNLNNGPDDTSNSYVTLEEGTDTPVPYKQLNLPQNRQR